MRKIILAAAMATATVTTPAMAQYGGYDRGNGYEYGQGQGIQQQIRQVEREIRIAAERRQISRNREWQLLSQLNNINRLSSHYGRDGYSRWERQDLQNRLQNLRQQVYQGRGWDDRNDGRWDRDYGREGYRDHDWRDRNGRDHDDDDDDEDDDD